MTRLRDLAAPSLLIMALCFVPTSTATASSGAQVYLEHCAACHQVDGQGISGVAPPLTDKKWLLRNDTRLVNVVLQGLSGPITVNGEYWDEKMPGFSQLADTKVAALLTYIRTTFVATDRPISAANVAKIRQHNQTYQLQQPILGRRIKTKKYASFPEGYVNLDAIRLPPGFHISVYADQVNDARSLALGAQGTVFVGNNGYGEEVYGLTDSDGDFRADKKFTLATGLARPNGIAFHQGDLYVAEITRILKFPDIEQHLHAPLPPTVIFDDFPNQTKHAKKYLRIGPDNKLYIPVGADCNSCLPGNPLDATITRLNLDGTGLEVIARGVRNAVGLDWHPTTGELWFSDNGRDLLGDDIPACEINHLDTAQGHFGFPFCHGSNTFDPTLGLTSACQNFTLPKLGIQAHSAPLGIWFYRGEQFPEPYRNALFIAEHGSWNRSKKVGYRIAVAFLDDGKIVDYHPFAEGWLAPDKDDFWDRPVDFLELPDGSLLVSDDWANLIYRIHYDAQHLVSHSTTR